MSDDEIALENADVYNSAPTDHTSFTVPVRKIATGALGLTIPVNNVRATGVKDGDLVDIRLIVIKRGR